MHLVKRIYKYKDIVLEKKAMINALGSVKLPPPATQPTKGGKAPITEPGTTAKAVFFFNGV